MVNEVSAFYVAASSTDLEVLGRRASEILWLMPCVLFCKGEYIACSGILMFGGVNKLFCGRIL
jgi:hypothetical protein